MEWPECGMCGIIWSREAPELGAFNRVLHDSSKACLTTLREPPETGPELGFRLAGPARGTDEDPLYPASDSEWSKWFPLAGSPSLPCWAMLG
eukprot:CAMPEP_0206268160 /NCGR_PEP_ID=MMETSP0047_2-20121206/31553_1 /ASSEMBLY_ACC=CAM_ASM_000192 /TAXON_ID=195065 /ORGANISM="Chroomonas mesostigmatica_cf, Strain CCMP1168" /LENGTH=91 /DNA_ID=CAMNT_0053696449 /DNA_START=546 /DNA_END=821 /DNA_ORIENTATION=-